MSIDFPQLTTALTTAHARWRPKTTPQLDLTDDQKRRMLGAEPDAATIASMRSLQAGAPPAPAFAPMVDWRNKNGNHITAVKDQGGCGSCVSFGCTGLVEAMAHIERGAWLDLSEADSHFCSSHGAGPL